VKNGCCVDETCFVMNAYSLIEYPFYILSAWIIIVWFNISIVKMDIVQSFYLLNAYIAVK